MEDKKPKRIKFDKRELPPYETKGRETPTIGISPIFIPTFVRNSVERSFSTEDRSKGLKTE